MLDEKDSINKINRFVSEPPGAWRMTDRTEIEEYYDKDSITPKRPSDREQVILDKIAVAEIHKVEMSPFCETNLCTKQSDQASMNKVVHPRRNIDYGIPCKPKVSVGVSKKMAYTVPDSMKIGLVTIILLMSVYALRR